MKFKCISFLLLCGLIFNGSQRSFKLKSKYKHLKLIAEWVFLSMETTTYNEGMDRDIVMQSDGTLCDTFVESLKDPISHIGFAIFMKSNHMTMEMVQIISRGKITPGIAGYLGLASGMMAQSIFHDLYYHLYEYVKMKYHQTG